MEPASRFRSRDCSCSPARKRSPPEDSRSDGSTYDSSRNTEDGASLGDNLYLESYLNDNYDLEDNLKAFPGSQKLPVHSENTKLHCNRLAYLTRKRNKEQEESQKHLRVCAKDRVCYEEFIKKNPSSTMSITKWFQAHASHNPPKFDRNPRFLHEKKREPCALDAQGHLVGTGSFHRRYYNG
jgi:hypothetical protein